MANHKSAAKRARQTIGKTARNKARKGSVRSAEKKLKTAVLAGDKEKVATLYSSYVSSLAKAVKTGLFHKNLLARKASRVAKMVQTSLPA